MSIEDKVKEWLRKMGYDGPIPSSLSNICTPKTTLIWEQLMCNVRPRQEAEHVRKNIIINRLLKKPLEHQGEFSYPIKEIDIYKKRKEKEKKIEYLEFIIEEKDEKINELLKKNNNLYVAIDHKKEKNKEKLKRKYLLEKKSKVIEEDIHKAENVLTLARNLTPMEMDENTNSDEVRKTLEKCAEILQTIAESNISTKTKINRSLNNSTFKIRTPNYLSKNNTFSKYLNQSVTMNELVLTSKKTVNENKENVNYLHSNTPINRCLFSVGEDKTSKKVNSKRESLGLLPADCYLDISEEIDNFLLSPNKTVYSSVQPLPESVFETSSNKTNVEIIENLLSEQYVKEILKNLLYSYNRFVIVTNWKNIFEKTLNDLRTPLLEHNKLEKSPRGISEDDLTELHYIHVKTELAKDKGRIILKKLQESVRRKKEEISIQLGNKTKNKEEAKQLFELKIEDVYLTGINDFLCNELSNSKKIDNTTNLQMIRVKIKQVQEEIACKNDCIEYLVTNIQRVLQYIKNNREETSLCVRKLNPFLHDLSWAHLLTQDIYSEEIETFKKFPLEYNRKIQINHVKVPFQAISDTSVPSYIELDFNNSEMFTALIDAPFCSAEDVIFNTLRAKITLNKFLSTLQSPLKVSGSGSQKYILEELMKREEYLQPIMDKLNLVINSPSVKEVLASPDHMKEVTNLWLEMPFRNYISDKRLVDGHSYKYYENILNELQNNLSVV